MEVIIVIVLLVAVFFWAGQKAQEIRFRWVARDYHRHLRQMGMGGFPLMPPYGMSNAYPSPDAQNDPYGQPSKPVFPQIMLFIIVGVVVYAVCTHDPESDRLPDVIITYLMGTGRNQSTLVKSKQRPASPTAQGKVLAKMEKAVTITQKAMKAIPVFKPEFTRGSTVQATAANTAEKAQEWFRHFEQKGYKVRAQEVFEKDGSLVYRLLVGNAATKGELSDIQADMVAMGFEGAFIRKIDKLLNDGEFLVY